MKLNKLRMVQWILLALFFYLSAMLITEPKAQTVFWKCGNITTAAFLGYWIDRNLFGRLSIASAPARILARAIVIGASIIGLGLGL